MAGARHQDTAHGIDDGFGMKVAMMQPAFLPWQGFFELIRRADVFVVLNDFQFSVQSYHQRNRLFINRDQVGWFTAPVLKSISFKTPLNEVQINESAPWRQKMQKRMQHAYAKAPFFDEIFERIAPWLDTPAPSLAEQNIAFIRLLLEILGWQRELRFSSDHPSSATRSQRVLELLRLHGATTYLAARGSFDYMLEDGVFPVEDICVQFQNFVPKKYHQVGASGEFVPFLSVLDALFNVGPRDTARLIEEGTEQWLAWPDLVAATQF